MAMTPKQLIEAVYEIAFGEDAHLRGFYPEEVVERLQEFSDGSNPILIEDAWNLSLIHISEPTRPDVISYAVFCL